jgi:hypothetical protein
MNNQSELFCCMLERLQPMWLAHCRSQSAESSGRIKQTQVNLLTACWNVRCRCDRTISHCRSRTSSKQRLHAGSSRCQRTGHCPMAVDGPVSPALPLTLCSLLLCCLFPPCHQAVQAFLGEMGLTQDELLARPQLVDAIRKSAPHAHAQYTL